MPILRAQVVLPGVSGLPEDVFVNTFHFSSASTGEGAADVIRDHLVELYNTVPPAPGSRSMAGDMSNVISRVANACKIKVYDLADAMPRIPIERSWTLGPSLSSAATELPAELAVCASFFAGVNRPRFRGRVYLGPWQLLISADAPTQQRAVIGSATVASVAAAFRRLIDKTANTQNLAVYSTVDNVARIVTGGWVDDAWDIQRRRGQTAQSRTLM